MKKWLDDLYAIILKRGFKTLDNSLKNYDTLNKQISEEVQSGLVETGQTISVDMNEFNSDIYDTVLFKCVFSDGRVILIVFIRMSQNSYIRVNVLGVSPLITYTTSGSIVNLTNGTDNNLTYKAYVNIM